MSQEAKDLRSQWAKNNPAGAVLDLNAAKQGGLTRAKQRQESCPIIHYVCPQCQQEFESRQKRKFCSRACGRNAGAIGGLQPNSTKVHRTIYKDYQMDSGAELAFAKLLDQHGIKWEKNSTRSFPFVDSQGKDRLYYPDFYLPQYNHWIEIKGKRYVREDDQLRLEAVSNIELIMSNNIQLPKCVGDP